MILLVGTSVETDQQNMSLIRVKTASQAMHESEAVSGSQATPGRCKKNRRINRTDKESISLALPDQK